MKTLNILTEISKRLIRFIVSILANFLNIIVSLIIILLNVYVSWNHTLELFHEAGFKREGYMDIAGVCAVELTFLLGSCHVIGARMKGRIPGWGSILTGALGVALIMWSNISAGMSHGITGVIIGIVVPLSIIACETILADAWRAQAQASQEEQEEAKLSDNRVGQLLKELKESDNEFIMSKPEDIPQIAKPEVNHQNEKPEDKPQIEKPEDSPLTKEEEENESHEVSRSPREWALNFYKQNEKLPSIRKLAEVTGISEWKARKLRDELKTQFG